VSLNGFVLVGGFGRGREVFTRGYSKGFVSLILSVPWLLLKERNNNHVFQFQNQRKSRERRAAKIRAIMRRLNVQWIAA
jgi:hypothetical protein